ncbi:MAG: uracil-DNA glycosylase [Candidatus Omnitrophica bacterium]|nr:uracil-DNA glycosylase [Candidatus Omnitrophota bacterium]
MAASTQRKEDIFDMAIRLLDAECGTGITDIVVPVQTKGSESPNGVAKGYPNLEVLNQEVLSCQRCALYKGRTHAVPGEGSPRAKLMFIGEGPGAEEDRTGRPFVGRAGQLLDRMIAAMGLSREQVYIANVVKCRPPNNRVPAPEEIISCLPYLWSQIDLIQPEVLCLLGRTATTGVLKEDLPLRQTRGRWFEVRGRRARVSFHPAYLLRNPEQKREAWEDLKSVMAELGLSVPQK